MFLKVIWRNAGMARGRTGETTNFVAAVGVISVVASVSMDAWDLGVENLEVARVSPGNSGFSLNASFRPSGPLACGPPPPNKATNRHDSLQRLFSFRHQHEYYSMNVKSLTLFGEVLNLHALPAHGI
jgi:hypothetical protein